VPKADSCTAAKPTNRRRQPSSVLAHDRSFSKNAHQKDESLLPVSFAALLLSQNAMSSIFMLWLEVSRGRRSANMTEFMTSAGPRSAF
jgi:hypothetical protein